jgi:hypothetical protein
LTALAKLAVRRDALRKELNAYLKHKPVVEQFYQDVTTETLHGHQYSASERREIDKLMRQRDRLLQRNVEIGDQLKVIEREGGIIKKHCTATREEIQAAIKSYQEKHGMALVKEHVAGQRLREAKAELRRLAR